MEDFLRWGLIFIGLFVGFLIVYDIFFRRLQRREMEKKFVAFSPPIDNEPGIKSNPDVSQLDIDDSPRMKETTTDDIIILTVLAKSATHFASYDLLQAISATGMQFGDRDIFHYYQPSEHGEEKLFSLASATKPGTFDLDRMGDFACAGLCLFMDKQAVQQPVKAFLTMLEKAEQLADDLGGELRAGAKREPWSEEILEQYLGTM